MTTLPATQSQQRDVFSSFLTATIATLIVEHAIASDIEPRRGPWPV
jgi:hypothetical protein